MTYSIRTAISSLWRDKMLNALCAFTIATGLLLIGLALTAIHNIDVATRKLPDRFSLMVYLSEDLSSEATMRIIRTLQARPGVKHVRYISKDEAMAELRSSMKDADFILEGMEGNPLPPSLEVRLEEGSVSDSDVTALATETRKRQGVEDVDYAADFLRTIQSVRKYVEVTALAVILVLSCSVLFVSYSTVKILLFRKQDEIDTLKLLGATKWFIRSPFLIEGTIIGLFGGLVAASLSGALYYLLYFKLALRLPALEVIEMPVLIYLLMPPLGVLLGLGGSTFAIGRIRF